MNSVFFRMLIISLRSQFDDQYYLNCIINHEKYIKIHYNYQDQYQKRKKTAI